MNSVVQPVRHGTLIYFAILCRQHKMPSGHQFTLVAPTVTILTEPTVQFHFLLPPPQREHDKFFKEIQSCLP